MSSSTSITRRSKLQREKTITSFGEFSEDDQSGPVLSPGSSIPADLISFRHSYGFNCKKPYNLYLLGGDTLAFLSGNLIHFLDTRTLQLRIRRSVLGTGIGCITKHTSPSGQDLLTIGENGENPPILIYSYPEMDIQRRLVGGAKRNHTRVTYSTDGLLLASQSGDPDYLLTIWKWREEEIVLRLPSFSKEVFNLQFSTFTSELLTSSGAGHIKFWQICRTFTGLKCRGQVGRFGQTELSDVYGLYHLEDCKVLSGSDWGNILVWENNAIKYEVFRKNHKTCHQGAITQIIWQDQEVLTISVDGYVRLWFWETVESSIPADGENFVEVEPIFEVKIGGQEGCQLMSMVRDPTPGSRLWYIQDGNGGIWSCEISSNGVEEGGGGEEKEGNKSKQLFKCHAGAIVAVVTSPYNNSLMATLGEEGRLHVYNYETHEFVFHKLFKSKGSAILWASLRVASGGNNLIVGFASGVIRVLALELGDDSGRVKGIKLIQKLKSHDRMITQMSFNRSEEILVTGSADHTIFVHGVKRGISLQLFSIGRVLLTSLVTAIHWNSFATNDATVLIGCRFGEIYEMELPTVEQEYTEMSYELKDVKTRELRFRSKKSEIKRLIKVKDLWYRKTFHKEEERSESNTEEGGEKEEQEEDMHFVPPIPNKILWLRAMAKDVLWVCVAQFDAGYIYEYHSGAAEDECQRVIPVPGCYDLEINSILEVDSEYLIFGLSNGMIRATKINPQDPYNLSDYWQLGMHDNDGIVTSIAFSYDRSFLFTSGGDGNLFQYQWRGSNITSLHPSPPEIDSLALLPDLSDDDGAGDEEMLSSEEKKRKVNDDERHTICDAEKEKVLNVLGECRERFRRIWEQNQSLSESQRLQESAFELDARITEDMNATLERKMKMAQREMEYDVERTQIAVRKLKSYFIDSLDSFPIQVLGIRSIETVQSLRFRKLEPEFYSAKEDIQRKMKEFKEESKERRQSMSVEFSKQIDKLPALSIAANEEEFRVHRIESVLREHMGSGVEGTNPSITRGRVSNLHTKIRRLLKKYKERKAYEQERKMEWEVIKQQKPNEEINHPDDVKSIQEAEELIGDYKLKLDADYVPPEKEESLLMKLQEIVSVQERIYEMKRNYNDRIFAMREKKERLLKKIKSDVETLVMIHKELPEELREQMDEYNDFDGDLEFPEKFIGEERKSIKEDAENSQQEGKGGQMSIADHLFLNEEGEPSPAESELKAQRVQEKVFEQDLLLKTVDREIQSFDEELKNLSRERLCLEMNSLFLETFLLTLQKEYTVISEYHEEEMKLAALADEKRIENGQFLSKILTQETALEASKKSIEIYKAEKRTLQQTFDSNCLDNKFTDFLKWIFEKNEEDVESVDSKRSISSESSSMTRSSREEEYSTASITSSNYDETFCPRGCDPDLYKLAFDLRQARFSLNRKIEEENQVHDRVKGDLEFLTKEIREIQAEQRKREEDYVKIRCSKQVKLNGIDTLIVLRLDQLQYFKTEREFEDISKTILFNRSNLMRLWIRVGELSSETLEIKRNHRVNIVLLSRLKSDCHFMEQQIQELRDQIKDTIVNKFGMTVDLDELQEALLTKLLFEIRLHVDDVVEVEFRRKVAEHKRMIADKQVELTRVLQEGTEKVNLLTVLHEEKNNLDEILANQIKLREKQERERDLDFGKDLNGLRMVVREQDKQIEFLQREIRTLSLKCKPFSSVPTLPAISESSSPRKKITGDYSEFGGSAYASVINSELSSDRQWTMELRAEMERVIGKFLSKYLAQRLIEKQIERISTQIAEYLLQVLGSYCEMRREELMPCIVEDVLKYLPRDAALLLKQSSVINLFDRILGLYKSKNDIERKDLIWGIVENACEVVMGRKGDEKRTNEFYIEIWRQLLITLPLDEVKEKSFMEEVESCMGRLKGEIQLDGQVDKLMVLQEVKVFVQEHATEDISHNEIELVLTAFFDCS